MKVKSLMIYALSTMLMAIFAYITPTWATDNNNENQVTSSTTIDQNKNSASVTSEATVNSNNNTNNNTNDDQTIDQTNDQNNDQNGTPDTATGGDDDY